MSLKELLSTSKTKRALTSLFVLVLVQHFSQKSLNLTVFYEKKIWAQNFDEEHSYEEGDT